MRALVLQPALITRQGRAARAGQNVATCAPVELAGTLPGGVAVAQARVPRHR
ncbi:hypothetical protein [Cupriavidus sp. DF5525]|uniref:hypothetical protein n=1 Tax=Cupriavidus sp. DF5525 TaxID=3160989 RepID=UPI0035A8ABBB